MFFPGMHVTPNICITKNSTILEESELIIEVAVH